MIHQSLVSKPLSREKFWPIENDEKTEKEKIVWGNTPEEAKENWNKIMGKHKVKK